MVRLVKSKNDIKTVEEAVSFQAWVVWSSANKELKSLNGKEAVAHHFNPEIPEYMKEAYEQAWDLCKSGE